MLCFLVPYNGSPKGLTGVKVVWVIPSPPAPHPAAGSLCQTRSRTAHASPIIIISPSVINSSFFTWSFDTLIFLDYCFNITIISCIASTNSFSSITHVGVCTSSPCLKNDGWYAPKCLTPGVTKPWDPSPQAFRGGQDIPHICQNYVRCKIF